jgi:tRNA (guanine6-N2)-methyltransferase
VGADKKSRRRKEKQAPLTPARLDTYYELEVIPGLAPLAQAELEAQWPVRWLPSQREDRLRFYYDGQPTRLLSLRRAVALHQVEHFAIPRPKALLGHQNFQALLYLLRGALSLHAPGSFESFCISAAGSDSSVFERIKRQIATHTGLRQDEEQGHLWLAVRRPQPLSKKKKRGWEGAVRLTPMPLSARPWRVCDMPGALNGSVASAIMSLVQPSSLDRVVNLACGSGTLLIERLMLGPAAWVAGCDISEQALACAQANLQASGYAAQVSLMRCDAGRAALPDGCATLVCADLPFGMLVGSHQSNEQLYPAFLKEAGRLVGEAGHAIVITQEVRLFQRCVAAQGRRWEITREIPIKLPANTRAGYIRPRIYLLARPG